MHTACQDLAFELSGKDIRPSLQRIKIMEYLINNPGHPTVEQIYNNLISDIPTLSKTTIYNTLSLFAEKGLIKILTIEETETRFDLIVDLHGHFKCEECGVISNFNLDPALLKSIDLNGYQVCDQSVYFKGLCPTCLLNINLEKERGNKSE